MYRSVLLPLDGTAFGEAALPFAVAIARQSGAALHVVHVQSPIRELQPADAAPRAGCSPEDVGHPKEQYLAAIAWAIAESGVDCSARLLEGRFVDSLVSHADAVDADLIVIATHARALLARAWRGSVAHGLVRRCHRPCLLIRHALPQTAPKSDRSFRHILIPLDGSAASEQVVPHAVTLGSLGGAHYTLLRILSPLSFVGGDAGLSGVTDADPCWPELEARAAQVTLNRVAARMRLRSVAVATAVVRTMQGTAGAICEYAAGREVDLVALATYGSGISRLALGDVAGRVTRASHAPVLLYRPAS